MPSTGTCKAQNMLSLWRALKTSHKRGFVCLFVLFCFSLFVCFVSFFSLDTKRVDLSSPVSIRYSYLLIALCAYSHPYVQQSQV